MATAKTKEQKLFAAAVVKMGFALKDQLESPAFKGIFPGLVRDLGIEEHEVDTFIEANRDAVVTAVRSSKP